MMKKKFFSFLFSAAILALASMGITASAEEIPTETGGESISIETSQADILSNEIDYGSLIDTAIEKDDITVSDSSEPDYYGDDFYDTSGNATLIKSEQIIYNSEEMQFIAVTTKDGHVFYVLINYSAENGEDNVYFLNKVDDYDLYALLYAGEEDKENSNITPEQAAQAAESANGRVHQDSSSDMLDEAVKVTENDNEPTEETPTKSSPMNMTAIYLAVGVAALGAVGFLGFKFLKKPKKKSVAETDEEDEINFYDDNEINEDE